MTEAPQKLRGRLINSRIEIKISSKLKFTLWFVKIPRVLQKPKPGDVTQ